MKSSVRGIGFAAFPLGIKAGSLVHDTAFNLLPQFLQASNQRMFVSSRLVFYNKQSSSRRGTSLTKFLHIYQMGLPLEVEKELWLDSWISFRRLTGLQSVMKSELKKSIKLRKLRPNVRVKNPMVWNGISKNLKSRFRP